MDAVDRDDRPHTDAGRAHIDQQERDAFLRLRMGIGAHQTEYPICMLRQCRPSLVAIDDVVMTILYRAGPQAGEIRPGARLRVALAPPVVPRQDRGQEAFALAGVSESVDYRTNHRQAE